MRFAIAAALGALLAVAAAPAAVAAARRPPWDIARFRPALRVAKLQAPDSVQRKDVRSFPNFQADHFYSENRDMVFVMGGDSQRSELRFLDEWSVRTSSTRRMVGVLTLPTPLRGMKHFTWMQVHGGSKGKKPLLRLSWHDKREQGGKDLRNTMLATVRLNNKSGDAGRFKKIVLGTRPSGRFVADVRVERSRLTVRLNGRKLVDEDVGYWTYSTNYFKAGGMLRLRGLLDVTGAVDVPACVFPSGGKPSLCPPLAPGRGCAWGRPPTGSARRPRQRVAWPGTYCPSRAL